MGEDGGIARCTAGDGETGEARRWFSANGLSWSTLVVRFWVGVASSPVCSESVDGQSFLSFSLRGHCTKTRASCTSIIMSASLISDVNVFPLAKSYFLPWQWILIPFHPMHMISTLSRSKGFGAGL
jgi:hypothetical protein